MKEGEDITFDQLLVKLKLTEQNCLLAIRSSLKAPTIFLKRKPNELRINNYNAVCLSAWRANMDIQFVLDVYACAMYIVSYLSKAQKGMSELLRTACEEARRGNSSIKQDNILLIHEVYIVDGISKIAFSFRYKMAEFLIEFRRF